MHRPNGTRPLSAQSNPGQPGPGLGHGPAHASPTPNATDSLSPVTSNENNPMSSNLTGQQQGQPGISTISSSIPMPTPAANSSVNPPITPLPLKAEDIPVVPIPIQVPVPVIPNPTSGGTPLIDPRQPSQVSTVSPPSVAQVNPVASQQIIVNADPSIALQSNSAISNVQSGPTHNTSHSQAQVSQSGPQVTTRFYTMPAVSTYPPQVIDN